MTDVDHPDLRDRLVARLAELRSASDLTRANRRPVELDQTSVGRLSRMDAIQQQSMAKASEVARLNEMRRIETTIRRIDEGDYGYCTVCDDPISAGRLRTYPTVGTCISCAAGAAGGAGGSARG